MMIAPAAPARLADGHALMTLRGGEGPPAVLFDAGAFGIYADGANLVRALAARGVPSASYTRRNLSGSEAAPGAPGPDAHAADVLALLAALGQTGPVVLVGHSMAGFRLHAMARSHPGRVRALVLVDAMVPGAWPRFALAGFAASLRPVERALPAFCRTANAYPNAMRLEGEERADKLRSVYGREHLRSSRREIAAIARATVTPAETTPMTLMPAGRLARGTRALAARTGAVLIEMGAWGHASVLSPEPCERIADAVAAHFA